MQNFTMNASQTLILGPNSTLWKKDTAELAFKHNFLMHSLLMFSARHLATLEPFEKQHKIHELQHRQHALGTLRLTLSDVGVTATNFDALIAANTLLAFHSCATYKDKDKHYDASSDEWLPLMNGVKNIVKEMWGLRQNSMFGNLLAMPLSMDSQDVELDGLEIMELLKDQDGEMQPQCLDKDCYSHEMELEVNGIPVTLKNKPLKIDLLLVDGIPNFNWTEHAHLVYKKVLLSLLPLLEAVRKAPDEIQMDMTSNISCALVAWPAMQPDRYIELIQNHDSKALIILAHYYAAMCHLDLTECWWLNGRPQAMCQSICRELGDSYLHLMRWPRDSCGYNSLIEEDFETSDDDEDDDGEDEVEDEGVIIELEPQSFDQLELLLAVES